jgi:hypothetical protein
MPILRVTKNGQPLCTVGSNDVWMFSASVWADIWGPEISTLDVSGGGKRRPDGESDFLIWEMPHELKKSDRVAFFFEEGEESSPQGSVFDPTDFPPEEPKIDISFPPTPEDIIKLEARPAENIGVAWNFCVSGAASIKVAPDSIRQHLSLQLLWNEDRPQSLRVNLSKSSLREITSRAGGEKLFLKYLPLGSSFEIEVGV